MAEEEIQGLDDETEKMVTLVASDTTTVYEIALKNVKMSKLVCNIVEGDSQADRIQVKQVDAETLELIVQYMKHHAGNEPAEIAKPIRSVKMEKIVEDPWDAEFINKLPKRALFQLILGANYMDCKSLLHLGCAKVATMIKGKSPEEIKQILGEEEA